MGNNWGIVSNSYATGSVSGNSSVGGLMGVNGSTISDSYATGSVSGTSYLGGLVGENDAGTVSNSFYATTDANGNPINNGGASDSTWSGNGNGTAKTSADLKQLATFTGWDIDDAGSTGKVWRIYEGDSHPLLRGFLTPLTITSATAGSKVYDGNAVTTVPSGLFTYAGTPDASKLFLGGTLYNQKNVGSYTAAVYSTQQGYDLSGTRSVGYTITPKALTASYTAANKVYDGTTTATVSATSGDIVGSDSVTISASGTFSDKNVGTGKTVTITGGALSGTDAANYTLQNTTGSANADITPKALSITGTTVANKTYDGTTNATVTPGTLSGFVGSETVSVASTTGTFDNKDAGTGKTVTVAYTLSDGTNGGLASNYTLAGTTHSADITPKSLTASYSAASKVYDGTTAATVSATSGDIVTGDAVTIAASGTFADKNVGTGKSVSITGGALSGADAGNYTLANSTGSASADITPKALAVSGITAANKVYDGTTSATVSYSDANFSGLISGDTVTASGAFADKNVGTGKTVNLTFGGADAGNYTFSGQSTTSADITPRPVQVAADAKSKFVGQSDPVLTYATGCPTGLSADCGLVSGESLAGSLSRDAGEAVGSYAIRQGTVTDANNPNYAISYQGADLSISAVELTGAPGDALASAQQTASSSAGTAPTPTPQPNAGSREAAGGPLLAALIRVQEPGIRLPEGFLVDEDERARRR